MGELRGEGRGQGDKMKMREVGGRTCQARVRLSGAVRELGDPQRETGSKVGSREMIGIVRIEQESVAQSCAFT